jgi:hypothetical protein
MTQSYEFDISIFPELTTGQEDSIIVEALFEDTENSEIVMRYVDTIQVVHPKTELFSIANLTHNI